MGSTCDYASSRLDLLLTQFIIEPAQPRRDTSRRAATEQPPAFARRTRKPRDCPRPIGKLVSVSRRPIEAPVINRGATTSLSPRSATAGRADRFHFNCEDCDSVLFACVCFSLRVARWQLHTHSAGRGEGSHLFSFYHCSLFFFAACSRSSRYGHSGLKERRAKVERGIILCSRHRCYSVCFVFSFVCVLDVVCVCRLRTECRMRAECHPRALLCLHDTCVSNLTHILLSIYSQTLPPSYPPRRLGVSDVAVVC